MKYLQIGKNEFISLKGEPHILTRLYLVLLSKMDFSTGLVGASDYPISYQTLCRELHVKTCQGRQKSGTPSIGTVRHYLNILCEKKLIESLHADDRDSGTIVLKILSVFQQRDGERDSNKSLAEISSTVKLTEVSEVNSHLAEQSSNAASIHNGNNHNNQKNNNKITHLIFKMIAPNFKPSDETIRKARKLGCCGFDTEIETQKFIEYNSKIGMECADWESRFIGWLLKREEFKIKNEVTTKRCVTPKSHPKFVKNSFDDVEWFDNEGDVNERS